MVWSSFWAHCKVELELYTFLQKYLRKVPGKPRENPRKEKSFPIFFFQKMSKFSQKMFPKIFETFFWKSLNTVFPSRWDLSIPHSFAALRGSEPLCRTTFSWFLNFKILFSWKFPKFPGTFSELSWNFPQNFWTYSKSIEPQLCPDTKIFIRLPVVLFLQTQTWWQ